MFSKILRILENKKIFPKKN